MIPEICATIKQYAREHLADLSIEFLFEYVNNSILPQLVVDVVEQSKEELDEERYKKLYNHTGSPK